MIALAFFSAICCAATFFIIKLYQYGPYIMTDDRRHRRKRPSNSRR
jgi:hypothetical protein